MSQLIFLDSGIVGIVTNPKTSAGADCKLWLDNLPLKGYQIILPEIVDYEVRRELIRANKLSGIKRLNQLKSAITYLPITTDVILLAADLWAEARKSGRKTHR